MRELILVSNEHTRRHSQFNPISHTTLQFNHRVYTIHTLNRIVFKRKYCQEYCTCSVAKGIEEDREYLENVCVCVCVYILNIVDRSVLYCRLCMSLLNPGCHSRILQNQRQNQSIVEFSSSLLFILSAGYFRFAILFYDHVF